MVDLIDIQEERKRVIEVAKGWQGTPYHSAALIKGIGADCITIIIGIFEEADVFGGYRPPEYPPDWHMHRNDERYIDEVLKHCQEISEEEIQSADMVLFKFGRSYSHGALITDWPNVFHAYINQTARFEDISKARGLLVRPRKFFRLKRWCL